MMWMYIQRCSFQTCSGSFDLISVHILHSKSPTILIDRGTQFLYCYYMEPLKCIHSDCGNGGIPAQFPDCIPHGDEHDHEDSGCGDADAHAGETVRKSAA